MTSFNIEITTDIADASRSLMAVERALSDVSLAAFLEGEASNYLQGRAQRRFASEGDDVSGKWTALSPATVEIRQSQGYGGEHPINKRTGELEAYITGAGRVVPDGSGVVFVSPGDSPDAEVAMKVEMAQKGGTSKWGNPVVARPVIGMNLSDSAVITEMLAVHIETAIRDGLA